MMTCMQAMDLIMQLAPGGKREDDELLDEAYETLELADKALSQLQKTGDGKPWTGLGTLWYVNPFNGLLGQLNVHTHKARYLAIVPNMDAEDESCEITVDQCFTTEEAAAEQAKKDGW